MSELSLSGFVDKVNEMMPAIMREFFRQQTKSYNMKITPPQFAILDILERRGECRMSTLAQFINVTTAAMTGIIGRLVRDGYVTRTTDPEDRRVVKAKLTTKGANAVAKMTELRKKVSMRLFEKISQKEREEYLNILTHVIENIKEPEKSC